MVFTIGNETDWANVASTLVFGNTYVGTILITASFSFTTLQTPIYLNNGCTVNGKCHTITFNYNNFESLFQLPTSGAVNTTIKNLNININNVDSLTSSVLLVNVANQIGNITNIHLSGSSTTFLYLLNNTYFGNTGYVSLISKCSSTHNSSKGICKRFYNVNFEYCFVKNSLIINRFGNNMYSDPLVDLYLINCYIENTELSQSDNVNGFFYNVNVDGTLTFNRCYSVMNTITKSGSAGFIGNIGSTSQITFNDCYVIGDIIPNSEAIDTLATDTLGGFIGTQGSTNIIQFNRCYSTVSTDNGISIGNGSLIGRDITSNTSTINIIDCHTYLQFMNTGGPATSTTGSSDSDLGSYFNNILFPTSWVNPSVWIHPNNGGGDYPILTDFTNTSTWDNTYLLSSSLPNFSSDTCLNVSCFAENTPIQTSHEIKLIQNLIKGDVLDGYEVEMVVKSPIDGRPMIRIEKNALGRNLPSQDIYVTKQHLFEINGKQISAGNMTTLNPNKIYQIKPISNFVYHIILKNRQYAFITVNELKAETLGLKFQEIMTKEMSKLAITL